MSEHEEAKRSALQEISTQLENAPKDGEPDEESKEKRAEEEARLRDLKTGSAGTHS